MRGAPSEYSGTDISASREEKRKAYDSEEITTKAVDWGRDKMCVKRCYTCAVQDEKVMTDRVGGNQTVSLREGIFTPTPGWERQHF